MSVSIPAPHPAPFTDGIHHPDLWLWDSWVMRIGDTLHLYCLALARETDAGEAIPTSAFNDYPFHYRHFTSINEGQSWRDRGAVLSPGNLPERSDSGNVWSGSVHDLGGGQTLFGYTGIDHASPQHRFVQTVILAIGTPNGPTRFPATAQSHPVRDHAAIMEAGYYLPALSRVGHNDGEGEGTILAWRDPFLFETPDGTLHALWSAKVTDAVPAVAHAVVVQNGDAWSLDLQPPIRLPDEAEYTQAEVPKLSLDADTGDLVLMISACNRLHEAQPDCEVWKQLRLYRSADIRGPWRRAYGDSAITPGTDTLFGASFLDLATTGGRARILSPRTAKADHPMTFAPVLDIPLS